MSELLPCPFCGSADVDHKFSYFKLPAEEGGGTYGHEPGCNACGGSAPAEIWNRRSALSQEAVRNEALEEAARMCEESARILRGNGLRREDDALSITAKSIRALKREPNAAAPAERKEPELMVANLGGAAAAPDVESAVKRLNEWATQEDFPSSYSMAYVKPRLAEAAALIAKLGKGWVPVSEEDSKGGSFLTGIPCKPIYALDERAEPYCWYRFDLPPLPPVPGASDDK